MASGGWRGEGWGPGGFSSEQLLQVLSVFVLCFSLPFPLSRLSQPSQKITAKSGTTQEMCRMWMKRETALKPPSDIMAAPPGVHLVALWLYIISDVGANDLFHSVSVWGIYRRANSLKRILVLATVVVLWRLISGSFFVSLFKIFWHIRSNLKFRLSGNTKHVLHYY